VSHRPWLPLLAALLLAACASAPRAPGEPAWTTGRLSVRVDATPAQASQGLSANFELRGDGQRGELRLNSPLGTLLGSARWSADEAVLTTQGGEQRFGDLDGLSRTALGEVLPLAALPDWLAGRPWAGAPHSASAVGFEQLGWQVHLTRRAEGWVEAHRTAPPAVVVRVKLDEIP
jgi:outer membrane lipoprotein LolB